MNKLLTALLAGLFAAALSTSALALDTAKTNDMAKKAVDSVKDKAAGAVTPAAKPEVAAPAAAPVAAPVATPAPAATATPAAAPAAKPMSHKKHKRSKKHHAK